MKCNLKVEQFEEKKNLIKTAVHNLKKKMRKKIYLLPYICEHMGLHYTCLYERCKLYTTHMANKTFKAICKLNDWKCRADNIIKSQRIKSKNKNRMKRLYAHSVKCYVWRMETVSRKIFMCSCGIRYVLYSIQLISLAFVIISQQKRNTCMSAT